MSVKESLEIFHEFEILHKLLKVTTPEEIIAVILGSPHVPVDVHPVLWHLDKALSTSILEWTSQELEQLDYDLDAFTEVLDAEVQEQMRDYEWINSYEFILWLSPTDVLIGKPRKT